MKRIRKRKGKPPTRSWMIPADPAVTRLFADLQLAWKSQRRPDKAALAKQFERSSWDFLMTYLQTLECPPAILDAADARLADKRQ